MKYHLKDLMPKHKKKSHSVVPFSQAQEQRRRRIMDDLEMLQTGIFKRPDTRLIVQRGRRVFYRTGPRTFGCIELTPGELKRYRAGERSISQIVHRRAKKATEEAKRLKKDAAKFVLMEKKGAVVTSKGIAVRKG
jgi:hypothetical protein